MPHRKQENDSLSTEWPPHDRETGELLNEPPRNVAEFTVSELSFALKRTLEDAYGYVRVRGEVGRVSRPGSGHVYLDLKDDRSVISAVVWKTSLARLRIRPEQGLEVVVTGKVTTFPGQSKYQIVIETLEPAGVGALMALLEDRRKRLAAEGLFDESRKKKLPYLPSIIGVVTSPTGAVIRDILPRLADRFPRRVLVWPVRVQGEGSAEEVAAAIRGFNALEADGAIPRPDILIVARGGGSLEDLWGFNEEIVVRAAAESRIPLISAVGHETDWTLLDHVADQRCPTPTAAAECAVPVRADLLAEVANLAARSRRGWTRLASERRSSLAAAARGLPRRDEVLSSVRQSLDNFAGRLPRALRANTRHHRAEFDRAAARLTPRAVRREVARLRETTDRQSRHFARVMRDMLNGRGRALANASKLLSTLSHRSVLGRGFAVVSGEAGLVSGREAARPGIDVRIEFHDGKVGARIDGEAPRTPRARGKPGGEGGQGSLL